MTVAPVGFSTSAAQTTVKLLPTALIRLHRELMEGITNTHNSQVIPSIDCCDPTTALRLDYRAYDSCQHGM